MTLWQRQGRESDVLHGRRNRGGRLWRSSAVIRRGVRQALGRAEASLIGILFLRVAVGGAEEEEG